MPDHNPPSSGKRQMMLDASTADLAQDRRFRELEKRLMRAEAEIRRLRLGHNDTVHRCVLEIAKLRRAIPKQWSIIEDIDQALKISPFDLVPIDKYKNGALTLSLPHKTVHAKPRPASDAPDSSKRRP